MKCGNEREKRKNKGNPEESRSCVACVKYNGRREERKGGERERERKRNEREKESSYNNKTPLNT